MTEATCDAFLGGQVHVFQPKTGFRAGTDSVLLAAALQSEANGEALELGCGAGGALLPAMCRVPGMTFTGVEKDAAMAELARRGVAENGFVDRADIVTGDVAQLPKDWANRFDLVFSNPPFFSEGSIEDPAPGKENAYIESLSLKDWMGAMLDVLRPKGTLILVHRAAELARILSLLERRSGEITVFPVRSFPGGDAKRVIVRARKGLRPGPLRLLSGLTLYESRVGARTPEIDRITRDGDGLVW